MLHLYIKQKNISMRDRMIVKDEHGNDLYLMVGKWGRLGDGLLIYAMNGDLVAEIKQTLLSIFPSFEVKIAEKKIAEISKYPGINGPFFKVSKLNWLVTGDFLNHEYQVTRHKAPIMTMSKAYLTWGDLYALSINDPQNALMCLCIAAIVDHLLLRKDKGSSLPPVNVPILNKKRLSLTHLKLIKLKQQEQNTTK